MAAVDVRSEARQRARPRRGVRALALSAALITAPASAAAEPALQLSTRWPSVPEGQRRSLGDHLTEGLTELGNALGHHLDLLSHSTLQLTVDGKRRYARIRIGAGDAQGLSLRIDSEIQLESLNARVNARIDLGFRGHELHLELPAFEMSPAEYRGDRGVAIKLPLFVRKF